MKCVVVCYLYITRQEDLSLSLSGSIVQYTPDWDTGHIYFYHKYIALLVKFINWQIVQIEVIAGFCFVYHGFCKLFIWKEFKQFCWIKRKEPKPTDGLISPLIIK